MCLKENSLIISCQAEGNDPFNTPTGVALFAKAAEMGGASAIRSEGIEKTKKILETVKIPVIGLVKGQYPNGQVCISREYENIENLVEIGCKIIAIDATFRSYNGLSGPEFISKIKSKFDVEIMADISTLEEALEIEKYDVEYISSTLNGYTNETKHHNNKLPNFNLIEQLSNRLTTPFFAEGRISTLKQAKKMMDLGASGVVIGTVITRPRIIVNQYSSIIK